MNTTIWLSEDELATNLENIAKGDSLTKSVASNAVFYYISALKQALAAERQKVAQLEAELARKLPNT